MDKSELMVVLSNWGVANVAESDTQRQPTGRDLGFSFFGFRERAVDEWSRLECTLSSVF